MRAAFALFGLAMMALPAAAQSGGGCSGFKWPIDREETAFAGEGIPTVNGGGQVPGIMEAVSIQLTAQDQLTFPVPPTHKPRNATPLGGVFQIFPVAVAGTYQVTLSDGAWIDVVQDGKLLKQTGFTDSKDCHAVRKSVRFNFAKGPATIEISDAAVGSMTMEVLPPP